MITQERLRELFEYRDDGNLIRKVSVGGTRARKGDVVNTSSSSGYYIVGIDKKKYLIHRLIFLYHRGYLTKGLLLDHIDGNKTNNRIENLREVTKSQNAHNSKLRVDNTSGVKGVAWDELTQKWCSRIKLNRKTYYFGFYDTIEEAKAAAIAGRNELHGDFAKHD